MAEVIAFQIEVNGIQTVVSNVEQLNAAVRQTQTAFRNATFGTPERAALQTQLNQLTAAQRQLNQQQQAAAAATGLAVGSYRQMNLELGQLRTRYRDLSAEERNGAIGSGLQRQIQSLNGELVRLDAGIGNYQRNVGNYASAFKGFGNIITGVLAGLGVGFGASQILEATSDYSKAVSELQAITGVSGKGLEELKNQISELTSITLEGGQVIVSTGKDIADALKLAGSARPELLSNTEALAAFTKEAIVFAKAGSLPVQDAVNSLSSVLSQFGLPASEAGRAINILAAGAKEGASEIKDTAAAIEQFGAGASSANISVEESVALVETLGDKFIKGSEAGTKIRNILLAIKAPQGLDAKARAELDKYKVSFDVLSDTTLPLSDRLRELSKIQGDANSLLQVFGKENVTAGEILLQNVDRFDSLNSAVTGTNEAYKQAGINADNLAQVLSNLKNGAINLAVGIGTTLYSAINTLIGLLDTLATFIDENKVALLAAGFAVAAYSASLNTAKITLLSFQVAEKLEPIYTYATVAAKKALTLAMNAVPYVAAGIAIYGLITAMQTWFGATEEQIKSQEVLLASQKELTEAYASEAQSAAELFAIAKSDVSSKEQKAKAVQRIIELYPDYLGGINTEAGVLNNLDAVQKSVNKGILDGAIARIKAQKIQEATTSLIDLELKKQQLLFEFQQKGIDANSGFAATALGQLQGNIDEVKKRIADLPTFLAKVGEGLINQNIDFTGLSVSDNQIKEVQKQLQELSAFRFALQQRTGLDLDEEGRKRYDFLVSEERRLQVERQKLIDANLNSEKVAATKSVEIAKEAEEKKTTAKVNKAGKGEIKVEVTVKGEAFTDDSIKENANNLADTYNEAFTDIEQGQSELDARLKQLHEDYLAGLILDEKAAQDEIFKAQQAKRDEDTKKEIEQRKETQQLLLNSALDLAREIADNVFSIQKAANEKELENKVAELETAQQAELDLAGNNATLISAINERYAAQKEALDRKAFEENKRLAIAQALINGALAATAVFTVPDFTFGVASAIRLGFIAANTAIQVGAIAAQKFATGGLVQGQGTDTSDNIPALLSPKEFVVRAAAVRAIGVDNLNTLNQTGSIASITANLPIPQTGQAGLSRNDINAIIQGVKEGAYQGTNSGLVEGTIKADRIYRANNKLGI